MRHLDVGQRCVGTLFIWTAAQGGEKDSVEGVGDTGSAASLHTKGVIITILKCALDLD